MKNETDQEWTEAISANPGDEILRNVYADYLEENGRQEDAVRQRRIAIGWKLMGDFKPLRSLSSNNSSVFGNASFDVWSFIDSDNSSPEDVERKIWKEVNLSRSYSFSDECKEGRTELETMEAVAEAYAKVGEQK